MLMCQSVNAWIVDILQEIGKNYAAEGEDAPLVHESIFRTYTLFNRLDALIACGDLVADFNIYNKLINQLISSTSVPFHGEPMLDCKSWEFLKHATLISTTFLYFRANEGNMPKGVNDTSFIPYAVMKWLLD